MCYMSSTRIILLFWVVFLALAGCGGGGGGSDQNDPANLAPFADAGEDRLVQQGSFVELDGSSSSDQDGQIVSFNWLQTRGTGVFLSDASNVFPSFIAPQTSTREELEFLLTVQDNGGAMSSDTVTITVNVPPIANAGADQTLSLGNPSVETVTLTGISNDSDGAVIAHQWVQTGGPAVDLNSPDTPTASFSVSEATAAYTFSYTVTDNDGAQTTDSVAVYVTRIIFSDTFSDGQAWTERWKTVNETASDMNWFVTAPANGDGQLLQNNNSEGRAFYSTTSYHLGTYAYLNGPPVNYIPLSYRFEVGIRPLTDSSGRQGNDVGIMFRYQDPSNYYRVSMNSQYGFTRLEKRENGDFQTLAVNSIGYVDDELITMSIEVNADIIIVWINTDPVFAVIDNSISSGTVALYCQDRAQFDNVLITENPLQPLVVISTPPAYSVALTRDDNNMLTAEAIVLNQPIGGRVEFSLFSHADGSETVEPGEFDIHGFFAEFSDLAIGEYDLMAVLSTANDKEVSHDINATVGVGGDYYVTVGDSITNGVGDLNPSNNDSQDGRTVAIQGYQAPLADALTKTVGLPQIVFNEGVRGDRAENLELRIDSILERHPGANKVLLMIGTNDANNPAVNPTDFRNQVLGTIAKINGPQVWLAKPMPTFINDSPLSWTPNSTRNNFIVQYNAEIDQIVASGPDTFLGPNFYFYFSGRTDLYFDYLHPNDAGYVFMADRWHDVLVQ